jgi:hypothetical protein
LHVNGPAAAKRVRIALGAFSGLVMIVAISLQIHYPGRALSGEDAAGTWLSGALLIAAMTLSLAAAARRGGAWHLFPPFFALLALDERFMFHERLKRRLAFAFPHPPSGRSWLPEAPVLAAALAGAGMAALLWRRLGKTGRAFLLAAAVLGAASVAMDVLALGAFIEDGLKLGAELALACALAEAPFAGDAERSGPEA